MARVKVFYDKEGNTLTVWFSDPKEEYVCEETGEEVVLRRTTETRTFKSQKTSLLSFIRRLA